MPGQLSFLLANDQPLVDVEVRPGSSLQNGMLGYRTNAPHTVPSFTAKFLIDTASPYCVIDAALIAAWRLRQNDPYWVQSGLQPRVVSYWHPLSLSIFGAKKGQVWPHDNLRVLAVPGHYASEVHKGIIGMDVLMKGGFRLDGKAGTFELSW